MGAGEATSEEAIVKLLQLREAWDHSVNTGDPCGIQRRNKARKTALRVADQIVIPEEVHAGCAQPTQHVAAPAS